GAVFAPVPTIAWWLAAGTSSTGSILAGYGIGIACQAAIAGLAGLGAEREPATERTTLWWPSLYTLAMLCNAMTDRALLLGAGRAWAAAGTFAYNAADAITLIV